MHTKLQPLLARNRGRGGHRGSLLTKKHPWYSGYAIPQNVWNEHDGAVVSRGLPRRAGGALRNVFISPGLPRGTIMQRMPSQFVTTSLDGDSLGGSSLGCYETGYGSLGDEPLGNIFGDIGRGFKKAASKVKGAAETVGGGIKSVAGKVPGIAGKLANKLGGLACTMSDAGLLDKAAMSGGAAVGGPIGAVGAKAIADAVRSKCGGPPVQIPPDWSPPAQSGIQPIHLAIGGGALVALLLVLK